MKLFRSRIAPTPSGYLHRGNLFNFLLTALITRSNGGELRLRIDDMDVQRARPQYLHDIFDTLNWLEIPWQQGPKNVVEHTQFFTQSTRMQLYDSFLLQLIEQAEVYACTCSRRELSEEGHAVYPGTCRLKQIPLNTPQAAWRIHVPKDTIIRWLDNALGEVEMNLPQLMGDFIIRRKDGLPAYQVVSLVDDLLYEINFIVRGVDLQQSTAAQLWLSQVVKNRDFIRTGFYHHPLLMHAHGEKLSKSAAAINSKPLHATEVSPQAIISSFSSWMGHTIKAKSIDEILAEQPLLFKI